MRRRRHAFETTYLREDPTPEPPETPLLLRTKEKDFDATANIMATRFDAVVVVVVLSGVKDVTKLRDVIQRKSNTRDTKQQKGVEREYATGLRQRALVVVLQKKSRRHSLVFLSALVSSFVGVGVLSKSSNL